MEQISVKQKIVDYLKLTGRWHAVHEIPIEGANQNNVATRLNEAEREGTLTSRYRPEKNFKEWRYIKTDSNGQITLM